MNPPLRYLQANGGRWLWLVAVWLLLQAGAWAGSTPVTLQLRWKHQFQFAGYYAALEHGYYREAGLDVTLKEGGPGLDVVDEVLAGRADFGIGTSSLVIDHLEGLPVLAVAPFFQHSLNALLVSTQAGSGLTVVAQQKPVHLASADQAGEIKLIFPAAGVPLSKVSFTQEPASIDDLLAGRISALNIVVSNEPFLLPKKPGTYFMIASPRQYGLDFYGDTLFTRKELERRRPEELKAFRAASIRGWQYALAHQEEIADLILARYNTQGKSREHLLYEAKTIKAAMEPGLVEIGRGLPSRWQEIADNYVEAGLAPKGRRMEDFLYTPGSDIDLTRFYLYLAAALAAIVLVSGIAIYIFHNNQRLRQSLERLRQAQSERSESESRFRILADSTSAGIYVLQDEKILMVNPAMTALTGYSRQELLGMKFLGLVHPEHRGRLLECEKATPDGMGAAEQREIQIVAKDGGLRWVMLSSGRISFNGRPASIGTLNDITDRRRIEEQLRESQIQYRTLTESMKDVVWSLDTETLRFLYISPSVQILRGYSPEEILAAPLDAALTPAGRQEIRDQIDKDVTAFRAGTLQPGTYRTSEVEQPCKGGGTVWTEVITHYRINESTGRIELHGVTRDISERKRMTDRLQALSAAIEQSPTSIVITDVAGTIEYVNPRFTVETGYTAEEAMGKNPRILKSGQTPAEVFRQMWEALAAGRPWSGELVNRRKSGELYCEEVRIAPVKDAKGTTTSYVAVKLDVTERKRIEEQIRHLAQHDILTGMPNRALFSELAEAALAAARRDRTRLALMFIDLDRFKQINDTLGHSVGDQLLQEIARRTRAAVREADTAARIGGDEFVVLLPKIHGAEDALAVAEKIRHSVGQPFETADGMVVVSASLGIAIFPDHGANIIELSKHADEAMYQSKQRGRDAATLFDPSVSS